MSSADTMNGRSIFCGENGGRRPADYWAEAIGRESQQHFADAAMQAGLAGPTVPGSGGREEVQLTFSLDEDKNILRWDMRQCPSKGS